MHSRSSDVLNILTILMAVPLMVVIKAAMLMAATYKKSRLIRNGVEGHCKVTRMVSDSLYASSSSPQWPLISR